MTRTPSVQSTRYRTDLGIVAGCLDLGTDRSVTLGFAVVKNDMTPIGRMHRLTSGRRKINDRQTTLNQCYPIMIDPGVMIVGAAMSRAAVHRICDER